VFLGPWGIAGLTPPIISLVGGSCCDWTAATTSASCSLTPEVVLKPDWDAN
jgi:hypothetical protein